LRISIRETKILAMVDLVKFTSHHHAKFGCYCSHRVRVCRKPHNVGALGLRLPSMGHGWPPRNTPLPHV